MIYYHSYVVSNHSEETSCPRCSSPVYIGEEAWEICVRVGEKKNEVDTHSAGYCSTMCANQEGRTLHFHSL